ncbi:chloride channel protein [Mycetohabitans sp. B46]|uniref:chloride channel protein n=1 Tax=Mycetohabitans sp. B46 TaxID=2772536 RepID=UPI00307E2D43
MNKKTARRARRLWLHYGVFWSGAIAVGLLAVLYAWLIDFGYGLFRVGFDRHPWLVLIVTPAVGALCVALTRRFFRGTEGSGIPQVVATLHGDTATLGARLLTLRLLAGKVLVSFVAILGGFTIGREGPTVQVGAALMFSLRHFYPERVQRLAGVALQRRLVLAGAAAGLSAAFNTPLAGIVFAIEELTRSFESRASGVLITAIIFAGVIALGLNGNYTYFGTIDTGVHFSRLLALAAVLTGVVYGIAGGLFSWLLLNTRRWLPAPLRELQSHRPVLFGALCGLAVAALGLASSGHTFGSGYAEARALLEEHTQLSVLYPLVKMASMIGSYLPGIPGGIFAPTLSIGAGIGNVMHLVFVHTPLPVLIALAMVGYLAGVTQSPITAFVIVIEMINGHALVISLMATALIAARVSRFFAPPLYDALSTRFGHATPPHTAR